MIQRDLIKDQIEQLGKALGKLLTGFLGLKNEGKVTQGIEVTNENLKSELDLDIEKILSLSGRELEEYLKRKKLSAQHIEALIDYIAEIGEYCMLAEKKKAAQIFERVLEMYAIVDVTSNTYSLERIYKEERIQKMLQLCTDHYHS